MIFLGYFLVIILMFIFIFPLGTLIKKKYGVNVSRKIIHISLCFIFIITDLCFRNSIHQIIISVLFLILNIISYKFKIFKSIEREKNNHLGTIYFGISATLLFTISYIYKELYPYTYMAALTLTVGDGFAAICGLIKKHNVRYNNKSLFGFIGCTLGSFIALMIFGILYYNNYDNIGLMLLTMLTVSLIAAIFELIDHGLDNLTVPIMTFVSMLLIDFLASKMLIALMIFVLVFMFIYFTRLVTYYGSLLAGAFSLIFYYFGSLFLLIFVGSCFLLFVIIHLIRKFRNTKDEINKKSGSKDFFQITANGLLATISVILFYILKKDYFIIISCLVVASNFIDSVSSDIGTMSKKDPYDFIHNKTVNKGLSGGISLLGTLSAIIGSLLLSLIISIYFKMPIYFYFILPLVIMFGTFIDTIIGSLFQVKYICPKCNLITEKNMHCGIQTSYYKGVKFINNDVTNLLSSLCVFIISFIIFII